MSKIENTNTMQQSLPVDDHFLPFWRSKLEHSEAFQLACSSFATLMTLTNYIYCENNRAVNNSNFIEFKTLQTLAADLGLHEKKFKKILVDLEQKKFLSHTYDKDKKTHTIALCFKRPNIWNAVETRGFIRIPQTSIEAVLFETIDDVAFKLYCFLYYKGERLGANKSFSINYSYIETFIGLSSKTARAALRLLQEKGMIAIFKDHKGHTKALSVQLLQLVKTNGIEEGVLFNSSSTQTTSSSIHISQDLLPTTGPSQQTSLLSNESMPAPDSGRVEQSTNSNVAFHPLKATCATEQVQVYFSPPTEKDINLMQESFRLSSETSSMPDVKNTTSSINDLVSEPIVTAVPVDVLVVKTLPSMHPNTVPATPPTPSLSTQHAPPPKIPFLSNTSNINNISNHPLGGREGIAFGKDKTTLHVDDARKNIALQFLGQHFPEDTASELLEKYKLAYHHVIENGAIVRAGEEKSPCPFPVAYLAANRGITPTVVTVYKNAAAKIAKNASPVAAIEPLPLRLPLLLAAVSNVKQPNFMAYFQDLNDREKKFVQSKEKALELVKLSATEFERRVSFENGRKY
ncbi:MAG: hypothetical protein HQK50_18785 [Oligoflexia bacterium]|nr:hypothetical protein [Oligoflexia bacterium]